MLGIINVYINDVKFTLKKTVAAWGTIEKYEVAEA
jgi:hypothetical protein